MSSTESSEMVANPDESSSEHGNSSQSQPADSSPVQPGPSSSSEAGPSSSPEAGPSSSEQGESSSVEAGPSSSRARPNPSHPAAAPNPDDDTPGRNRTRRGQPTDMPERSAVHRNNVERVTTMAAGNDRALVDAWNQTVQDFWAMSKEKFAQGQHENVGRDIRDFAAVATRTIPADVLEVTLMRVYRDMPDKLKEGVTLAGTFEIARQAATTSIRAAPGARRDIDVSKWRMFLWFGREICKTVRQMKNISATLGSKKKTGKVSFEELTNRLWRRVLQENAEAEEYPEPTAAHLRGVVRELQAEKAAADEAEQEASAARAMRRQQVEQEQRDRRRRNPGSGSGSGPQQQNQVQRGTKRARANDEDSDEEEDDSDDRPLLGRSKRRRRTPGNRSEGDDEEVNPFAGDDNPFAGDDEDEIGRGDSFKMGDDFGDELRAGETVDKIDEWLAGTAGWIANLEGPQDPDGIIPDDVKFSLAAAQNAMQAAMLRLREVRDRYE